MSIDRSFLIRREIDLWRQLTNLTLLPSTRKKSIDDQLIACKFLTSHEFHSKFILHSDDLTEKKTVEFHRDSQENAPMKVWNYIARHLTNELIDNILHESAQSTNNSSNGHHAIKKARRTNDAAQKIRPSTGKSTGINSNLQSKGKRTTRRSRM